jgi:protein-S-isoprenylcysteine O-methyltransferase Ste14
VTTRPQTRRAGGNGVLGKAPVEQLKLVAVYLVLGLIVYYGHPTRLSLALGLVPVALGLGLRIWACGHLTRDQQLTTSGPYQHTRHPLYLGRLALLLGLGIMTGHARPAVWLLLVGALLFFFGIYLPRKERREGRRLQELFGSDYERWCANVPLFWPRLRPYRMNPRPWRLALYLAGDRELSGNKELGTTLGVVVLVVLLYLRMVTTQ